MIDVIGEQQKDRIKTITIHSSIVVKNSEEGVNDFKKRRKPKKMIKKEVQTSRLKKKNL
jgi:hypothetical protein